MTGVQGGHRPTSADRRRYQAVVDAARAVGRLNDTEWSQRRERIQRAMTSMELQHAVADLPGQPSERSEAAARAWLPTIVVACILGLVGAGIFAAMRSASEQVANTAPDGLTQEDPAGAADQNAVDLFAPGMFDALLRQLDDDGVTAYESIDIWPDRASFEVQVAPGARQYDIIRFADGGLGEREPSGELDSEDEVDEVFFEGSEIKPGVIAAMAGEAAGIVGLQDRPVGHMSIERDSWHGGVVTISVYLESDDYGSGARLVWDATGQHLLEDGT